MQYDGSALDSVLLSIALAMAKPKSELPISYLGWRSGLGREATVLFDDREWALVAVDRLWSDVEVDGRKAPFVEQSRLFAKSIAEATGERATSDADGEEIPFARIANFLTIGFENEDLLCADPTDRFSVWACSPSEGGMVERLADTLDEWMEQAEPMD
jgi:hypothetical protein